MNGKLHFDYLKGIGLTAGDIADLHLGSIKDNKKNTPVIIKIARNEEDNDLLKNEATVLKDLMAKMLKEKSKDSYSFMIPDVLESFEITNDTTPKLQANMLEFFPGFFDVEAIRKLMPSGVDGRTLVWMFKRLMGVLSWVHHFRYIHGAVLPPHVMFFPDGSIRDERIHSLRLVDWCYSLNYQKDTKLKAWLPDYVDFYPPEVIDKRNLGAHTDIYMAAKTMLYVAGGNVKTNKFPSRIPAQIANQISKCLEPDYRKRVQSVTQIFQPFVNTAKDVYGAPKFAEFKLPI